MITTLDYALKFQLRLLDCRLRNKKHQKLRSIETDNSYSLKPFDDKKAIFIHLPKCAGVSVNKALFGNLAGGHLTYREYQAILGTKTLDKYFTFTFVRNPWDRVVSAYHFLKNGGFGAQDKHWFDHNLGHNHDFNEFVLDWLTPNNIWKKHHFRPQTHYLKNRQAQVALDFIGRVENMALDFDYVAKRLNCDVNLLEKSNISQHLGYHNYFSQEAKERVAKIYKQDIEMFGYNFSTTSNSQQIESININNSHKQILDYKFPIT
ncbi:sulfotransferase family 2 domain-containing protein [Colwellia sp. MEBiC06753]